MERRIYRTLSGRVAAKVEVEGNHRCVKADKNGNIYPLTRPEEPTIRVTIGHIKSK